MTWRLEDDDVERQRLLEEESEELAWEFCNQIWILLVMMAWFCAFLLVVWVFDKCWRIVKGE